MVPKENFTHNDADKSRSLNGSCSGTQLICRGFDINVIHAEIITGQYSTKQVFIPRIQLLSPENKGNSFKFIQKQFPMSMFYNDDKSGTRLNNTKYWIVPIKTCVSNMVNYTWHYQEEYIWKHLKYWSSLNNQSGMQRHTQEYSLQ